MSREIKFRIWDTEDKDWATNHKEWIRGSLIQENLSNIFNDCNGRYIFQQYTGLKDENGKEIYEGDIVKYKVWDGSMDSKEEACSYKGEVNFKDGRFTPLPYREECGDTWYSWEVFGFVVVGNVFENLDLLK